MTPTYVVEYLEEKILHCREMRQKCVLQSDKAVSGAGKDAALDRAAMWGNKLEAYEDALNIAMKSRRV